MVFAVLLVAGCGRSSSEDESLDSTPTQSLPSSTTAVPTETTTTETPTDVTYVIQPGDSLSVIAERFGISTKTLADFNAIADVDSIKVGQEIAIPPVGAATPDDGAEDTPQSAESDDAGSDDAVSDDEGDTSD
jgi:LysM repeat protein